MKKIYTLLVLFIAGITWVNAQENYLPDQNPNYLQSQHKYMGIKDSLLVYSNTTIDQSYKAYDFYQARLERRQQRRDRRYNVRMIRAENSYYPSFSNYGYSPWNSWGTYGSYFTPRINYRTGNWWFGL